MAKTSLDIFRLRREDVWTCLVSGDRICEMNGVERVRTTGDQNRRSFLRYSDPW